MNGGTGFGYIGDSKVKFDNDLWSRLERIELIPDSTGQVEIVGKNARCGLRAALVVHNPQTLTAHRDQGRYRTRRAIRLLPAFTRRRFI